MDGRWRWSWGLAVLLGLLLAVPASGAESAGAGATLTAWVRPNPLKVTLRAPRSAGVGESFRVQATLENLGSSRVRDVAVQLHLDTRGLRVLGKVRQHRGVLWGRDRVTVEWRVRPLEAGEFLVLASATAREAGDGPALTAESEALVVTVEE